MPQIITEGKSHPLGRGEKEKNQRGCDQEDEAADLLIQAKWIIQDSPMIFEFQDRWPSLIEMSDVNIGSIL